MKPALNAVNPEIPVVRAEARHREVVEAARRVIVRQGLADTTLRDVAREGGFTTGLVTHYFPDKRAVIFGAFMSAWTDWLEESRGKFVVARSPRALVHALVDVAVPPSRDRRAEWRLWAEMWAYAGSDEEFARQLLYADGSVWEVQLRSVIFRLQQSGLVRSEIDAKGEATIVNRLMDGLGLRAWLTGRWDDARDDFILHLASMGLPADLVDELLRHD